MKASVEDLFTNLICLFLFLISLQIKNWKNVDQILLNANLLFGSQPNFVYCKTNKIGLSPRKVHSNKFLFHLPRKVYLKSRKSQLVFLNISCAFPYGTNTIFREVIELKQSKHVNVQILNVQDGSTFVNNFLIKITNNSRFNITLKRSTPIITVKILNALRELTPIKVKKITYNTENCDTNGVIHIEYDE
jgi:hypothetical protein